MRIARIAKNTLIVSNVEMADAAWLEAHSEDDKYLFVQTDTGQICDTYEPANGQFISHLPPTD